MINSTQADQPDSDQSLTVVGIGASAGGLTALQDFFDVLSADTGMAFVVVTHMDPERESLLPELLQSHTSMPVRQVQGEVKIEANHVYVTPPNRRILITDTHLDTEEFEEPRGRRTPIDYFFRSLANVHRNAIAIILSGGGTDGAVGVKDIKEQGGLLLVQHPDEAEYDGMPRAAISTGLADLVLPVRELAERLIAYRRNGVTFSIVPETLTTHDRDLVHRILAQVQARVGHDFSQYKQSTLLRRVERRLHLTGYTSLDAYLMYLRHTPDEAQSLYNDLLIGVTNFFRDQESWQALAETVIPQLFEGKESGQQVRVWTIGCSTGEEAYTVAMLLLEHASRLQDAHDEVPIHQPIEMQVFASDLDDDALAKAREGLYPESIETDVSPQRLERFFTKEGHYYRVRRELRNIVLFTNHSVLRDPPFSHIDLISCRNLMIYLNRELQENVLDIFHYALNPDGYLFLGNAESADMMHELFRTLDKTYRLYQARPWKHEHPHVPSLPLTAPATAHRVTPHLQSSSGQHTRHRGYVAATLHQEALEAYGPPSVLVDEDYHVLHVSETAGRYLLVRRGSVSNNLLDLIRPELQVELRAALFDAFRLNKAVLTSTVSVQFNGTSSPVMVSVRPRQAENQAEPDAAETETEQPGGGHRLALVCFLEHETAESDEGVVVTESRRNALTEKQGEGESQTLVTQLQAELTQLRERLRASAEEYERSTEELKAANEELQSINEEYSSTTEELQTSKEELQSVNEELQTVNVELKSKLEEIIHVNSDLENLMASTQITTLFLDRELNIKRFTTSMEDLFNILPGDRGRSITHLTNKLDYDTLAEDAAQVLRTLVPVEREIYSQEGQWFLVHLRPYRTVDDHIDGVVLTFVDITAIKEAEADLREANAFSESIVDTLHEGLVVLEPDLRVQFANDSFLQMFQVAEAETVGKLIFELGNGQWDISSLRQLLEVILPQQNELIDFRVVHDFEQLGHRVMLLKAQKLSYGDLVLLAIEDITEREHYEQQLRDLNETLEARVQKRTQEVQTLSMQLTRAEHEERRRIAQLLHDDLQQQLFGIKLRIGVLQHNADQSQLQQQLSEMEAELDSAIRATRQLSVDLSPPVLQNEDLVKVLVWLSDQFQQQYRVSVKLEAEGAFLVPDTEKRILLFRVIRELIFNAIKHANVQEVIVRLQPEDAGFRIDINDEGVGFEPKHVLDGAESPTSWGLINTRERLHLIGGHIKIESAPGAGTHIMIYAPIDGRSQDEEEN